MGAKGSAEQAKLNAENWGNLEVCMILNDMNNVVKIGD